MAQQAFNLQRAEIPPSHAVAVAIAPTRMPHAKLPIVLGGAHPDERTARYCRPTLCTTCRRRNRRITSARWRRSRTWILKRSTAALKSRSR